MEIPRLYPPIVTFLSPRELTTLSSLLLSPALEDLRDDPHGPNENKVEQISGMCRVPLIAPIKSELSGQRFVGTKQAVCP